MPFLVNFVPYFFPGNPNKMSGGGHWETINNYLQT
jgi:hypothetical protein